MYARLLVLSALLFSGSAFAFQSGDWVLAQWRGAQFWFPGVVERVDGNSVVVAYDDGTRESRPLNQVKPYDWTVGTHVECRWAGGRTWYSGRITAASANGKDLRILYDDGDREETTTAMCRSR